jgi:ribosomal protein S27AE
MKKPTIEERFYALIPKKNVEKKRKCLKCGKVFKIKQGSRRVCSPCAVDNDRMGLLVSHHNVCL